MGQKVHPYGLRLGVIRTWNSVWFREKNYADWLHEDLRIRKHIKTKLYHAGISNVDIKRTPNRVDVFVHTSKPGLVIGKKGKGIEQIKKDLQKFVSADLNPSHDTEPFLLVERHNLDDQLIASFDIALLGAPEVEVVFSLGQATIFPGVIISFEQREQLANPLLIVLREIDPQIIS